MVEDEIVWNLRMPLAVSYLLYSISSVRSSRVVSIVVLIGIIQIPDDTFPWVGFRIPKPPYGVPIL